MDQSAGFYSIIDYATDGPDTQRALIEAFAGIRERRVATYPGYVAARLLASTDGTRVLNVVAWETEADYRHFDDSDPMDARLAEIQAAVDGVPGTAEPQMSGLPHFQQVREVLSVRPANDKPRKAAAQSPRTDAG